MSGIATLGFLTIFAQTRDKLFLESRRDDPVVKERENALQSLDLAYFKYREITRNLDEGFKVYFFSPFEAVRQLTHTQVL